MKSLHIPFLDGHLPVHTDLYNKHANALLYLKWALHRTLEISTRQSWGRIWTSTWSPSFCKVCLNFQGPFSVPRLPPLCWHCPHPPLPCSLPQQEEGGSGTLTLSFPSASIVGIFQRGFLDTPVVCSTSLTKTYKPVLLERAKQANLSVQLNWAVCFQPRKRCQPDWRNHLPDRHLKRNRVNPLNETFSAAAGQKIYPVPMALAVPLWVCVRNGGYDLFLL